MYCGKCGSQIDDGLAFCTVCGAPVNNNGGQSVQPVAQMPTAQEPITLTQAEPVRENGFAIAGLIISLVALIFISFKYMNILVPGLSLVFSILGVCKKNSKRKGMAIAGIIISSIWLVAGFSITFAN